MNTSKKPIVLSGGPVLKALQKRFFHAEKVDWVEIPGQPTVRVGGRIIRRSTFDTLVENLGWVEFHKVRPAL